MVGCEAVLGPMLALLGRSWGLCWLSWGLCWRSWAVLGAYVGGLGSGSGPKLAVLGPKWSVLEAIRAKSGPNPSGKAIWQADQGGKVAQTRAGRPFWGGNRFPLFSVAGSIVFGRRHLLFIFSVDYIYIYIVNFQYIFGFMDFSFPGRQF